MSLISDLTKRVAALEKTIQTRKQRRRLNKRQVAEREGVSTKTIDRRVPKGFPTPEVIQGRHYWWEHELDAYDAELAQEAKKKQSA